MTARRIEQNQLDEQRALLLLSGLSLTRRQALPSGTFLIRTQIACLAFVFLACRVGASSRVQRAVWFCVAAYPKGFIRKLLHFCRAKSGGVQAKNSGIHPDRQTPSRPHILRAT